MFRAITLLLLFYGKLSSLYALTDNVPASVLQDVPDFLKELQQQPPDKVKLTNNLRQILADDKELLERLAQ